MTIKKARKILGEKFRLKTDQEIQEIIDRLYPLVKIVVKEAEKKFGLNFEIDLYLLN